MNGARHESPFTLEELDTTPAEQKHQSSAAQQESEDGNSNSNGSGNSNDDGNGRGRGNGSGGQHSVRGMSAPRAGDLLDSMDASDLWLDAGVFHHLLVFDIKSTALQEC